MSEAFTNQTWQSQTRAGGNPGLGPGPRVHGELYWCLTRGGRHRRKRLQCIDPGPKPDLARRQPAFFLTRKLQDAASSQAWLHAVAREAAFDKFQLQRPARFQVVRTRKVRSEETQSSARKPSLSSDVHCLKSGVKEFWLRHAEDQTTFPAAPL